MHDQRTAAILDTLPVAARVAGKHTAAGIPAIDSDDLAATATLAIIRAVDEHDGTGTLKGYAGRQAKLRVIDEIRRMRAGKKYHHHDVRILSIQAHAERLGKHASPGPAAPDPADAVGSADLHDAIGKLPPLEGTIIVRHYIQGQTLKTIAADLLPGRHVSRASQIKKQALDHLAELLS